jgi:hypothetical protein
MVGLSPRSQWVPVPPGFTTHFDMFYVLEVGQSIRRYTHMYLQPGPVGRGESMGSRRGTYKTYVSTTG